MIVHDERRANGVTLVVLDVIASVITIYPALSVKDL